MAKYTLYLSGLDETAVAKPRIAAVNGVIAALRVVREDATATDAVALVEAAYKDSRQQLLLETNNRSEATVSLQLLEEGSKGVCSGAINPDVSAPLLIVKPGGKARDEEAPEKKPNDDGPNPSHAGYVLLMLANGNPVTAIQAAARLANQGHEFFERVAADLIEGYAVQIVDENDSS